MNKTTTASVTFILGVGAGWIIQGRHWDVFVTSYIPALATLLAAFYGAKYAFQFQKEKEIEDTAKRNLVNVNAAIFTLSRMANQLFIYQRDVIAPARESPVRLLELRPTLEIEKELIELDIQSIYFILETEDRNLLSEVIIEEERYRVTIDAINTRSRLHLQEVQPLLEQAGFVSGNFYDPVEIEGYLGSRLYSTLQQYTDQLVIHVDSTLISTKDVANRLKNAIKILYPNEKVITFTPPS